MKSIVTIPLLLSPLIRNAPINVENYIYFKEPTITQYDNYKTVIRQERLHTAEGQIDLWQLEKYQQDDGDPTDFFLDDRQTFTIVKITNSFNANINITRKIRLFSNTYNNALNNLSYHIAYIEGIDTDIDDILNYSTNTINTEQQDIAWDLETIIRNDEVATGNTQFTNDTYYDYDDTYTALTTQQYYYFVIEQNVTSEQNLTNVSALQSGISNIQIYDQWVVDPESSGMEVVDIGGLMWQILSMPFAFISTAFNFTFFQNTPYAINVANILFTIVGALIIIFVIRKFIK